MFKKVILSVVMGLGLLTPAGVAAAPQVSTNYPQPYVHTEPTYNVWYRRHCHEPWRLTQGGGWRPYVFTGFNAQLYAQQLRREGFEAAVHPTGQAVQTATY